MSVDPFEVQTRHYGSEYAMVDYKSNSANLYMTVAYNRGSNFSAFGTVTYTTARASMDRVIMPDITSRLYNEVTGETDLTHQDFTFPDMDKYSDLEYNLFGFHVGFEYMILDGVTFTADGEYYDLTDKKAWVFGDESGSFYMIRTGIRFSM